MFNVTIIIIFNKYLFSELTKEQILFNYIAMPGPKEQIY